VAFERVAVEMERMKNPKTAKDDVALLVKKVSEIEE
jgi:hypothetical protein